MCQNLPDGPISYRQPRPEAQRLAVAKRDDVVVAADDLLRHELRLPREDHLPLVERKSVGLGAVAAEEVLEMPHPESFSLIAKRLLEDLGIELHGVAGRVGPHRSALAVLVRSEVRGTVRASEELRTPRHSRLDQRLTMLLRLQRRKSVHARVKSRSHQVVAIHVKMQRRDGSENVVSEREHAAHRLVRRHVLEHHTQFRKLLGDLLERR